ncbi:hypothetical protein [Actinospica robiniae]|uniref:hypothetical protein n=1 Tax=Actinospica robiniae TaxID=304901 RepID=UPI0003FAA35F|nr:hypothetical protein [Actinospica robiniae]
MLRREADGVAWYLARKGYSDTRPPGRVLELRWTCRTGQTAIGEHLVGVVEDIQRAMARIALPVEVERLSIGLGTGAAEELPYSAAGLSQLVEQLALDASARVTVVLGAPPRDGRRTMLDLSLHTNWWASAVWSGRLAPGFNASGVNELDPLVDAEANAWSVALAEICHRTDAVWGSVMLDYEVREYTAYELYFGIQEKDGEARADEHPRGYHWANILSAGHIRVLGGRSALEKRCAELGLDALPIADEEEGAILVRDPRPISEFDDERLGAMRELLDPILLHEPYHWYAGAPLRVFKEPGTAFRPIPLDLDPCRSVFDDDEQPDDDDY